MRNTIAITIVALMLLTSSALASDIVTKAPKKIEMAPASCFDLAAGHDAIMRNFGARLRNLALPAGGFGS
jgi:hypothetical protein